MSESIETGGPAFPQEATSAQGKHYWFGMSLRDWFAGQALVGICAHPNNTSAKLSREDVALSSYAMADAMLAAREVKP